jgi:PAS domain S-box-containing protein
LLALEHAVADLVTQTSANDELLVGLLAAVCTTMGWLLGAAWLWEPATQRLRCAHTWHHQASLTSFAAVTSALSLRVGTGLPGLVWKTGLPKWIPDVRRSKNFPRAEAAREAGLAAAMSFPITSRDGMEALVEFFTDHPVEPDERLLATAASMGRRVGDALHRNRTDEAIRRSEARLRAVVDAALDCVVLADATGRVLEFNPAACATFGYTADQAIGRELAELIVPPSLREAHRAGFARFIASEQSTILDRRLETTGMRADGSEFPVELTITRVGVPGLPVFAAYLRDLTDVRRAQQDLRASRRRVLDEAIRERQRLERDLHDGAQQQLISLGLILARSRATLIEDPLRSAAMLDDALVRLEEAAVELRNLARGIHPSSLTRYGLAGACADLARRASVKVRIDVSAQQRFPMAVEATAYFVISEALANVARHAPAAQATVTVTADDSSVTVEVADDGPGGAEPVQGTGLRGLADRLALLDGSLKVDSSDGHGTRVVARIPLPAAL